MSQLSYTNEVEAGYEGAVATAYPGGITSGIAVAALKAGKVVTIATGGSTVDQSVRSPAAAADVNKPLIAGLVVRQPVREDEDFAANSAVSVLRRGQMFVRVEDAVVRGTHAFVRHVAAGAEVLGSLRSDADGGGPDATLCTGITFLQSVGAGEICLVDVNL